MPTAGRTSPSAPAQSSHSQGSENSTMPMRRGRRKREPFREKRRSTCTSHLPSRTQELREPCRLRWLCVLAPASLGDCPVSLHKNPAEPWGSSSHLLLTVKYIQMQPWARGHSHALQSQRTSRARRAGTPPAPHQQQCTEDPSFQVQLPSHQHHEACILNSSAHLILAYPTVCAILLKKALALSTSKPLIQVAPCNILWLSTNCMEKVFFPFVTTNPAPPSPPQKTTAPIP